MSELKEKCAIFGTYHPEAAKLTYFGLSALQHRGQEASGIFTMSKSKDNTPIFYSRRNLGLVSQVFTEDSLEYLSIGNYAIGHNRYSTSGDKSILGIQPIYRNTALGGFAIAHNGNITNAKLDEMANTDTEWLANLIQENIDYYSMGWSSAIINALRDCEGAYSILVLTPIGIFAMRDPKGYRPLVIGIDGDTTFFASETCALDVVGAEFHREVKPGELVWLNHNGLTTTYNPLPQTQKFCIFEKIYFSRPDSVMDSESLSAYRHRLGQKLAINDRDDDHDVIFADYVFGVPDSGTPAAIGYAEQLGLSYRPGIVKNRYSGRTFISPTQEMRDKKALLKYNIIKEYVYDTSIVLVDDSIVRGTTMKKLVRDLYEAGASEVHVRITAPPIMSECRFGIDTHDKDLIAKILSVEEICQEIGADSLRFLSAFDVEQLAYTPTRQYCTDCFYKTP